MFIKMHLGIGKTLFNSGGYSDPDRVLLGGGLHSLSALFV